MVQVDTRLECAVAQLESDLKAKGLGAELKAAHVGAAASARHLVYACIVAAVAVATWLR